MAVTQIVPTARSGDSSKIVTAREAVRLIRSGDTVAIGGFGGIGFAEAIIHELADFYQSKDTEPGTFGKAQGPDIVLWGRPEPPVRRART